MDIQLSINPIWDGRERNWIGKCLKRLINAVLKKGDVAKGFSYDQNPNSCLDEKILDTLSNEFFKHLIKLWLSCPFSWINYANINSEWYYLELWWSCLFSLLFELVFRLCKYQSEMTTELFGLDWNKGDTDTCSENLAWVLLYFTP